MQRLQQLLPMLVAGRLDSSGFQEGQEAIPGLHTLEPPNYIQLVRLLQCGLDLELNTAAAAHADKVRQWVPCQFGASRGGWTGGSAAFA